MRSVLKPPPKPKQPRKQNWTLEDELLRNFRLYVLRACFFNRTWTAHVLGISLRNLRMWLGVYKEQGFEVGDNELTPSEILRNAGRVRISPSDYEVIKSWTKQQGQQVNRLSENFWRTWRRHHVGLS